VMRETQEMKRNRETRNGKGDSHDGWLLFRRGGGGLGFLYGLGGVGDGFLLVWGEAGICSQFVQFRERGVVISIAHAESNFFNAWRYVGSRIGEGLANDAQGTDVFGAAV